MIQGNAVGYTTTFGQYDHEEGAIPVALRFADADGGTVWETTRNVASNDPAVLTEVAEGIVRDVLGTPALSVALADVPVPVAEVIEEADTTETVTEEPTGA